MVMLALALALLSVARGVASVQGVQPEGKLGTAPLPVDPYVHILALCLEVTNCCTKSPHWTDSNIYWRVTPRVPILCHALWFNAADRTRRIDCSHCTW
jgi:hypothetical protein